ncbi:MAG: SPOR domain-containing protein [Flavobacteriales bacterium]|nr:SPOR domain-containing protein [Flavobacteriales bacterium]
MKKIDQHIFELLFQHDCVILTDFGGFVANYVPAKVDENTQCIYPPAKRVIFNKYLTNNDGLLAHKIIANNSISYEQALIDISRFIGEIKSALSISKRFEIDKVGVLFLDPENNICFKPSSTNFLISSFGMSIVKAIPLENHKESTAELPIEEAKVKPLEIIHDKDKLQPIKNDDEVIPISAEANRQSRRNRWWVAAALIPIVFYSAWIPVKTDLLTGGDNFQYSDLNPFTYSKKNTTTNYKPELINSFLIEEKEVPEVLVEEAKIDPVNEGNLVIETNEEVNVSPEETVDIFVTNTTFVEKENVTSVEPIDLEKGYFVIGGCFAKKSNADRLVETFIDKGYEGAMIIDQNKGLHRVSFGKYGSRKEAKKAKKEIKSIEGISAWVLKK